MTTAVVAPEPVFVDTNVVVYAAVPAFPLHVDARMRLTELEAAGVCLWISRQSLREYLSRDKKMEPRNARKRTTPDTSEKSWIALPD